MMNVDEVCVRNVKVESATASASVSGLPEPAVLCMRPLPCDNPNHVVLRPADLAAPSRRVMSNTVTVSA